ncbi:MAG: ATP-binding cassette domain-containing protein [Pseudomonadota bacterium]
MLEVQSLSVAVNGKLVVRDVSLTLPDGQLHLLLGPNGSGKSSLLSTIMGLPPFEIVEGDILLDGSSIIKLDIADRARLGIGIAFQRPPRLDGVSIRQLARSVGAADDLAEAANALDLDEFLDRDMQVGFSGGEVKRAEVLKLRLQNPALMLFDEPESGVDLEHVKDVGRAIEALVRSDNERSALVITHTGLILNHVAADRAHVMTEGRLTYSGPANAVFDHVQAYGYGAVPESF